ncbi:MAG: ABC transporter permease [Spirochaetota bacterium]|nr:MAG: ABC transporter permease [Spirochaetota bacterium]
MQPVIIVLLALILIFGSIYPDRFFSSINFKSILRQFVTLMLFALGPTFVVLTGRLDLSYVGVWMLGGIFVWLTKPFLGLFAILMIPVVGAATGLFIGVIQTKAKIPSFILTLSLLVTYTGLSALLAEGYPRAVDGYEFITAPIVPLIPTSFLLTIPIIAVALFLMKCTRICVYLNAIGSNEEGAQLAGINVDKYKILAFTLSGVFTGIGAMILFQHLGGSAQMELKLNTIVWPLVAIVLGGTPLTGGSGGPQRTLLGAITFTVFYRGLYLSALHPTMVTLLVGVLLIISIIISARGLKGVTVT